MSVVTQLPEGQNKSQKVTRFVNYFTPPDELEDDEVTKYTIKAWWSVLQANRFKPRKVEKNIH